MPSPMSQRVQDEPGRYLHHLREREALHRQAQELRDEEGTSTVGVKNLDISLRTVGELAFGRFNGTKCFQKKSTP